jgi:hypothetical protein
MNIFFELLLRQNFIIEVDLVIYHYTDSRQRDQLNYISNLIVIVGMFKLCHIILMLLSKFLHVKYPYSILLADCKPLVHHGYEKYSFHSFHSWINHLI